MIRSRMFLLLLTVGALICGLLILRHATRTALPAPPRGNEAPLSGNHAEPVDQWQRGIRLDTRNDYSEAVQKLQREERRQRPEEQRN